MRLPWNQRIRNGFSKRLIRRAFRGEIPESVLARRNFEHVGPAFSQAWIENEWRRVEPGIDSLIEELDPYFTEHFLREQFCAFMRGDRGDITRLNVFALVALATWLKSIH